MTTFLTGRTRTRANWRGKLILQVQVGGEAILRDTFGRALRNMTGAAFTKATFTWRDARAEDLFELQHLTYGHVDVDVRLPDVSGVEDEPPVPPTKKRH